MRGVLWRRGRELINILLIKICITCKTLSNRIKKSEFKNEKSRSPGRTIKAKKVLCAKYAFVIGIANGILMAQNNRCLLIRHGDNH